MNYPDFKQVVGEKANSLDGLKIDRAADGSVRTRSMWDRSRSSITVRHLLTLAQRDELQLFYNGCRTGDARFDFTWRADGKTYRCIFSGPPDFDPVKTADGIRWWATCSLLEV